MLANRGTELAPVGSQSLGVTLIWEFDDHISIESSTIVVVLHVVRSMCALD